MKTLTITLDSPHESFIDEENAREFLEEYAERLYHIKRSAPLTRQERDLRAALGKAAYAKLSDGEKKRMLAGIQYANE